MGSIPTVTTHAQYRHTRTHDRDCYNHVLIRANGEGGFGASLFDRSLRCLNDAVQRRANDRRARGILARAATIAPNRITVARARRRLNHSAKPPISGGPTRKPA